MSSLLIHGHLNATLAAISSAIRLKASACGPSGLATTVGFPASASAQILGCSGISPSSRMPSSSHFFLAPFKPKMSCSCPHFVQTNVLMFRTTPSIGTPTFLNRSTPLIASRKARSCGVEITTAPSLNQPKSVRDCSDSSPDSSML